MLAVQTVYPGSSSGVSLQLYTYYFSRLKRTKLAHAMVDMGAPVNMV